MHPYELSVLSMDGDLGPKMEDLQQLYAMSNDKKREIEEAVTTCEVVNSKLKYLQMLMLKDPLDRFELEEVSQNAQNLETAEELVGKLMAHVNDEESSTISISKVRDAYETKELWQKFYRREENRIERDGIKAWEEFVGESGRQFRRISGENSGSQQ